MATPNREPTKALVVDASPAPTADDIVLAVEHARRAAFGALAVVAEILARSLAESVPASPRESQRLSAAATRTTDTVLGVGWWASRSAAAAVGTGARRAGPLLALALDPPLLPARLSPRARMHGMTEAWAKERQDSVRSLAGLASTLTRAADGMVRPLVPVEELLARLLDLVDLDRLLQDVIDRTDLQAALVAALERIDVATVVVEQVDLVALAQAVIDGVDLPAIVRQSSGSIATETVDTVRLQGIDADRAVARIVDRLLLRGARDAR